MIKTTDKEILKDAELDAVAGGSGSETFSILNRLQRAGLYTAQTPLTAGNEAAATKELQTYLNSFTNSDGSKVFGNVKLYADGRTNEYGDHFSVTINPTSGVMGAMTANASNIVSAIRALKGGA